jgi:arylsulfatase A-like enzyme
MTMKCLLFVWSTLLRGGLVAVAALLAGATGMVHADENPARSRKPNIILILADDLGWRDLGCYGSTFYETPHLDALARQGMSFTNAYAAAAVCSPTRASLMTGKYPARLHLTHIIQAPRTKKNSLQDPDWTPYLPLDEVTLAKALKPAGYATALIGKWHLGGVAGRSGSGDGAEGDPRRQGFDVNVAGSDCGQPPDYFFPYSRTLSDGKTVRLTHLEGGKPGEYLTDRLTDEAEQFVTRHQDRPFFLFLSHFAPHTAMGDRLQAPESLIAKFKKKVNPKDPQHDPVYAAMLSSLDEGVGRLLKKLDDLGLADNTLVIFTSDNGGLDSKTSNLPLRGDKGTPYEGGLRVPAIIRWPGQVKPGSSSDTPIISPDFYPTVLEAASVKAGPRQVVDGLSLVPLLTGAASLKRPSFYWHFPHCDLGPYSVVRQGDFKLIEFISDDRSELYNLREDREEKTNLVDRMPEKLGSLRRDLAQWRESVGAQLPTKLSDRSDHGPVGDIITPDNVKWQEGPASLRKGVKMAVMEGDPRKEGPFVLRMKLPDGFRVLPHSHPKDERVTVISGTLYLGMGDKFDEKGAKALPAGSYARTPAGRKHFGWVKGETVLQLHGEGPWSIEYVDPKDDPRERRK